MCPYLTCQDTHLLLRIKAVPGASRNIIAGPLGDRLKIRVSAPPNGGKANQAILKLLAGALGTSQQHIEIASGHTTTEKLIRITGLTMEDAVSALEIER